MSSSAGEFDGDATAVLERVTDGFFALDEAWTFTYVNERAERLIGREASDLLGTSVWDAFPEAVDSTFDEAYHRAMETQEPVTFESWFDPLDAYFEVRAYPSETGLSVYFRDVTDRHRRQEQLEAHRDKLAGLVDRTELVQTVHREISSAATREAVESAVCRTLADSPFYEVAWIGAREGGRLTRRAGAGVPAAELDELVESARTASDAGGVGAAMRRETVHVTQNVGSQSGPRADALDQRGYGSAISLPLVHDADVLGVLTIYSTESHAFGGTERDLLSSLADTVAYALDAAEREERYRSVVRDVLNSSVDAGVVVVDADERVAWSNQRAGEFFGFDPETAVGHTREAFAERWVRPALDDPAGVAFGRADGSTRTRELHLDVDGQSRDRYVEHRRTRIETGLYAGGVVELFYDVTERKRSERALSESERRRRTLLNNLPGIAYQCHLEPDWPMEFVSDGCRELTGYDPVDVESGDVSWGEDVIHEDDHAAVYEEVSEAVAADEPFEVTYRIVTADGETRWVWERGREVETTGGDRRIEGFVSDVTDRRRRQTTLERLDHLNAVIRRIDQRLVGASDRETVKEAVCSELDGTDHYCASWFAEVDLPADELVAVAGSGIDVERVDPVEVTDGETVASRAIRSGETTVGQVETQAQRRLLEPTDCAVDDATIAAIPVTFANTEYGALCICAEDASVFSPEALAVFDELGETIGHALNAQLRKEGLLSDTATQLELRLRNFPAGEFEPSDETTDGEASFTFEETIVLPDGNVLQYVDTDVSRDTFEDLVEAIPTVDSVERLTGPDGQTRYELRQTDPPMVDTLATYGGRVASVTIDGGDLLVVAELPDGVDVREVVEQLFEDYPGATLEAQRSVQRSESTAAQFRDDVQSGLTDRQRTTLEVAYFAGYFEWPRVKSGEEVAESLDVSQSTFSQHLRAGERKLLELLFES